jgi:hypothetical protein
VCGAPQLFINTGIPVKRPQPGHPAVMRPALQDGPSRTWAGRVGPRSERRVQACSISIQDATVDVSEKISSLSLIFPCS